MKHRAAIALAAAALLLLAQAGCAAKPDANEQMVKGFADSLQSVPEQDFTLEDLNGGQWTLSDQKGRIVLLNFWATWCGPCQAEMPEFQKLYEKYGKGGDVIVLAVASEALERQGAEQSRAAVADLVKEQGYTFPVLFDEDGSVWGVYQQEGIPANYIIDKKGNVRLLVAGAFRGGDQLEAAIEAVRRADSGS